MSRTQVLHELQQTDLVLEAVARRLKEITASLGESDALRQARQQVADAETHLHACHARTKDLDLEVRSLGERVQTNEQRLYGGRVTNPKELSSLQDDAGSLKRWRDKKEEEQLEAMLAEEEAEARLAACRAAMAQTDEAWQAEQSRLLAEQTDLQARQREVGDQRALLAGSVSADDLAIYEQMRPRKGGRAVAPVKGGLCLGCRMTPPVNQVHQASAGLVLVFCNNCGRIMHVT
jgi:predicted  nucleic acid-binding Zn-ribbon protein